MAPPDRPKHQTQSHDGGSGQASGRNGGIGVRARFGGRGRGAPCGRAYHQRRTGIGRQGDQGLQRARRGDSVTSSSTL